MTTVQRTPLQCRSELSKICPVVLVNSIRAKIQELNATLFNHLNQIKTLKLEHLIGPKISSHATFDSQNTVVTIPENLPLTDSEKSVLSKGLNFVPIAKRTDEFSVKQDVEKFLRRIQLKAFFHDKEDNSNASDKDIFETLHVRKSKWTPPEDQFASLDFFIKKCRHDIQKLKFNCDTKFSNLSSEEWVALKNLSKRQDIIIKSADKGGAVVVWRSDLYKEEALRQLSDTSFYAKVEKDLTSNNQKVVKDTIQNLIVKQELPATAALYTVIPNSEGLQALRYFFDQRTVTEPSSETLLRLAELVLTLNCFSFAGNYYKQINGVAMGTKMGPSYANLFVGYVEHQFFNQYDGPKPDLYGRYIDDCIGAISSSREELNRFITSVNSFHPPLKYTWEISETSLAFLDIKVSISGNGLCTSVHYKPTDSHSYLLHSSSHPSHVKNSIPYSQFLRLRRLCSDDSDFSNKSEEMCQFFEKRGYPASVIQAAHHRAQQFDRQSALQTSQKEKNDRIPFTLTFHPRNNPVKAIILNNFKILQNDPVTGAIFSQPPLISFKRDKNVGNFLVRSAFKTIEKPGTFKCARSRCKTCPFVQNADKISGPKRSVKITDRFTCTSANVIYCITCTLCKKLYIGETGRRLGDRFREHLRDVEKDDKDASKPVARHFNLPNHSKEHMSICGLSLHQGTTDSRKNLEQRFIFQIGTVNPHGINERFSFN